ncbi:conserved hypothetical protein [Nitrosococcus halophilus Nc 4]|uniref:DUF2267 domain-containing protein n=1 Tax=Nitrosococcus halophilus (strain Nc4) TaxID=472759 RepID=D5BZZ0_NITHN|nr:DUF2267 domain-containing protein [Nitrosococcus halophilus]ADE16237.1 conserved hypothetical protein [Nitrosococcus halophilus Nc 4]
MSATGLEVFDSTLQKTSLWLNDLMMEMGWKDRHKAYSTLRAVLHVLRDRLMVDEAVDLGAQLPMLVRGFYYEGWRPAGKPLKYRHKEEFLNYVTEKYRGLEGTEQERAVSAVFKVLSKHVTGGEIEEVRNQLPEEVRALWP